VKRRNDLTVWVFLIISSYSFCLAYIYLVAKHRGNEKRLIAVDTNFFVLTFMS
jgi:hypothetical protein